MKLIERLNVLIQAITISQKNGILTLDEAVKAKSAIDVISNGTINQNFTSSINMLIELIVLSQKKGAYTLKDAHMIYLALEGMEDELQNEISRISEDNRVNSQHVLEYSNQNNKGENVVSIPPKVLDRDS